MTIGSLRRFADPHYVAEAIRRRLYPDGVDAFFRQVKGIIHVGANVGQERDTYAQHGLNVLWIEPIPDVFQKLQENVRGYPKQRALHYLVTDKDGEKHIFHVANNDGLSSSILNLHLHKDIWPDVSYVSDLPMESKTLSSIVDLEKVDLSNFDSLVLDTQGSELLVLRGAAAILPYIRFIKTEVADFEAYKDCAQLKDIRRFLRKHGFREWRRTLLTSRPGGGRYFEAVFKQKIPA